MMSSTSTTETGCLSGPPEATSFPLLDLPREIREHIYIAVLRTSASPPSFAVSMADHITQETLCGKHPCRPMYPLFPLPITTSALLTVNRQVHAEVKAVISRNEITRPLTYKLDLLDCMMAGATHLYATWLSIPALSSSVDVVEANFRLFGDLEEGRTGWTPRDGSPGQMNWMILTLLRRFVKSGPDFLSPPKSSVVKIGELVLNVVTPEEPSEGEPHYVGFLPRNKRKGLMHSEQVLQELAVGMRRLWHGKEGKILRKSVGVVRICLDGQEMGTWDVKGMNAWRRPASRYLSAKGGLTFIPYYLSGSRNGRNLKNRLH